jgi:hypothetical protein
MCIVGNAKRLGLLQLSMFAKIPLGVPLQQIGMQRRVVVHLLHFLEMPQALLLVVQLLLRE